MILYFDTSALVKLFVEEAHSTEVRTAARLANICVTGRIAYVEFLSALARREREGMDPAVAQRIRDAFEAAWPDLMVIEVGRAITVRAAAFARLHRLRAYDAIHLASAQEIHETVPDMVFACFDDLLNLGARNQGMKTL
ncbi:MAG: type II toxin-antitoxin system VapC family toxin [Holophaga sp.]